MSKGKAIAFAITALFIASLFLPAQLYGCSGPFLLIALFYGAVAWYKHLRDVRIVKEAETRKPAAASEMELPPMTSKGSNRLFVPQSLQHDK